MKPAKKGPSAYPEFRETALRIFYRKSRKKKIFEWPAANIGKEAAWPAIPADGARKAAMILRELLGARP
jgi:hypothetical protein